MTSIATILINELSSSFNQHPSHLMLKSQRHLSLTPPSSKLLDNFNNITINKSERLSYTNSNSDKNRSPSVNNSDDSGSIKTSKRKMCARLNCDRNARSGGEYCIKHGGGPRCFIANCKRGARDKTGFCIKHGGGPRCAVEGCTKGAIKKNGFCINHSKDPELNNLANKQSQQQNLETCSSSENDNLALAAQTSNKKELTQKTQMKSGKTSSKKLIKRFLPNETIAAFEEIKKNNTRIKKRERTLSDQSESNKEDDFPILISKKKRNESISIESLDSQTSIPKNSLNSILERKNSCITPQGSIQNGKLSLGMTSIEEKLTMYQLLRLSQLPLLPSSISLLPLRFRDPLTQPLPQNPLNEPYQQLLSQLLSTNKSEDSS